MKEISTLNHLVRLKEKLNEGKSFAIDIDSETEKTERLIEGLQHDPIKVALIGSFSTGKTSVLAGLLGRFEDSMIIDVDESTDDITCHPYTDSGYEFIDTPGLFGTKKKIYGDREIKLSDITKKYVSEAHVLLLVTSANPPLKESHFSMIKYLLRDLGKLESTIFVINRLDDTGISISDESQYRTMCANKIASLISQLRDCINLSETEEKNLKVACVAADPGEKGVEYWFKEENKDKYEVRSHMETLRAMIDDFVKKSDGQRLKQEALATTVKEIIDNVSYEIDNKHRAIQPSLEEMKANQKKAVKEVDELYKRTKDACEALCSSIGHYFSDLKSSLQHQNHETLSEFLIDKIGVSADGKSLSFEKVTLEVNDIVRNNLSKASDKIMICYENFNNLGLGLNKLFDFGLKQLQGKIPTEINVSASDIKNLRNIIMSNYKFKPYEAKTIAENVSKGLSTAGKIAGPILALAPELFRMIKNNRDERKARKLIGDVHSALEKIESAILDELQIDKYIKQVAPEYQEMKQRLEESGKAISNFQSFIDSLTEYKNEIAKLKI